MRDDDNIFTCQDNQKATLNRFLGKQSADLWNYYIQ